jgi:Ca2+:H+ antiporter
MNIRTLIPLLLLLFVPLAIVADQQHWDDTVVFVTSAAAIIPLSLWLSIATEKVAVVTGPLIGGLINAVFGSATILILALMALRKGLIDIVESMITGSILTALLLLLGLAMFAGGLRYKEQLFKPIVAQVSGSSMTLAVIALALPTMVIATSQIVDESAILNISLIVSVILIVVYGLTLLFALGTHRYLYNVSELDQEPEASESEPPQVWAWVAVLLATTVGIAVISDIFVDVISHEIDELGLTPLFTGVILLPLLSDVASCIIVIRLAFRNQMDLTVSTVTGDSLIVALLIAPVLVWVGQAIGQPVDLNFNPFEVIAIAIAVIVTNLVSFRGRSTWLDGALLLATYLVLGVAFYYHPS